MALDLIQVKCYLCPGNRRAQGDQNPDYKKTFVFVNDYSAVKESQAAYHPEAKTGGQSKHNFTTESY